MAPFVRCGDVHASKHAAFIRQRLQRIPPPHSAALLAPLRFTELAYRARCPIRMSQRHAITGQCPDSGGRNVPWLVEPGPTSQPAELGWPPHPPYTDLAPQDSAMIA